LARLSLILLAAFDGPPERRRGDTARGSQGSGLTATQAGGINRRQSPLLRDALVPGYPPTGRPQEGRVGRPRAQFPNLLESRCRRPLAGSLRGDRGDGARVFVKVPPEGVICSPFCLIDHRQDLSGYYQFSVCCCRTVTVSSHTVCYRDVTVHGSPAVSRQRPGARIPFCRSPSCPSTAQKVREFTGSPSLRCSALANCRGTAPVVSSAFSFQPAIRRQAPE
jgi:hypothetical protein